MAENTKKPVIRFAGFTEAWEQRKVANAFKVTRGYVLAATQTDETQTEDKPYPVYSSQTKDNGLMGYHSDYLYEDAITWTTDGANAGTVRYRAGKFYCTNVCGVLLADKIQPNQMVAEALNNVAKHYVSYVGNPKLMNNVMSDIEIMLPTQEAERDQISVLFRNLDNLITLHQRKYDKLICIKKSCLEKMFPKSGSLYPEVRFAGFTEAWEQRKLGDVAKFSKGQGYTKSDLRESGTPIILYGRLYTKYQPIIREVDTYADEIPGAVFSKGGEVILPSSGETAEDIAIASSVDKSGFLLGGGLNIVLPHKEIESAFLAIEISFGTPHSELAKRAQGKSVVHLYNEDLKAVEISYPKSEEQKRISKMFDNLDNLITLHQRELEKLKNLKKACLEKMFV